MHLIMNNILSLELPLLYRYFTKGKHVIQSFSIGNHFRLLAINLNSKLFFRKTTFKSENI